MKVFVTVCVTMGVIVFVNVSMTVCVSVYVFVRVL